MDSANETITLDGKIIANRKCICGAEFASQEAAEDHIEEFGTWVACEEDIAFSCELATEEQNVEWEQFHIKHAHPKRELSLSEIEAMPFGTECVVEAPDGSSQSIGRIVEFGFIEFGVMKEKESAKHLIKSGYKITEL